MSRASELRDDIATELATLLSSDRVDSFVLPDYEREELKDGARIGVRVGGREIEINPGGGPHRRFVTIEIGVIGNTPTEHGDTTRAERRAVQVALADTYDAQMEEIIEQWSPWGPLSKTGFAGHRFVSISQPQAFDARQMYDSGVWVAIVSLEYEDSYDETPEE